MDRLLHATAAAEDRHFWFAGLRRNARHLLVRGLGERPPGLIVDCGAGTGRNLDWLQALGPAVGVELSPAGLAYGRRHGRRLVRGTVACLPFADGSAGVATSFDVLYALNEADEQAAVREMWRILHPGGLVLVNVAALSVLRGSHSALTREQRRYSRRGLVALLTRAGFVVERVTFTNLIPFPFALVKRLFERMSGRATTPSEAELAVPAAPINLAFDAALRLEAAWLRLAPLPIGTSLMVLGRKSG